MKKALQLAIQTAFLMLFIFLVVKGKVQFWMALLLLGIVSSFIFGRFYCGWICSINTAIQGAAWIKNKLHIKSRKIPQVLTRPWVRYLALGLFVVAFVFTMVTGKRLPVLPALFVAGVLLTFIYPEELWHRYLCPYGMLLSAPAAKARKSVKIDAAACNNCDACRRVCPAKAVEKSESKHRILKVDCLVCMECSRSCKKNAISYR